MTDECKNYYKICRENAGLTQKEASNLLAVGERTLSAYENGTKVPDEIVDKMAEVYNAPLLAWWHLKTFSILGKYLPDIQLPKTNGDMAFQTILANDQLKKATDMIKGIMADGVVTSDELDCYNEFKEIICDVTNKLMSVKTYDALSYEA